MSSSAIVTIHESQFPENVLRDLLNSLRDGRINHRVHYDSVKQTQKWLALHQVYSPSRNDGDCAATYNKSFESAVRRLPSGGVHVLGLGCGGGQKDTRLLALLRAQDREVFYTPCDVSTAMVLVARQAALAVVAEEDCFPFVCDLALAEDLPAAFASHTPQNAMRMVTLFGMIPNFEPQIILPRLAALVGPKDLLLLSANLAPGQDYVRGMKEILPQYDNALTREWLMSFLLDLGVERNDGELRFSIENGEFDLKRIMARFHFTRERHIEVESERFAFDAGTAIQLFFSYRYTLEAAKRSLAQFGIEVLESWIAPSGEEAVFLCRKEMRRQSAP